VTDRVLGAVGLALGGQLRVYDRVGQPWREGLSVDVLVGVRAWPRAGLAGEWRELGVGRRFIIGSC
jgi:hypothetical protein